MLLAAIPHILGFLAPVILGSAMLIAVRVMPAPRGRDVLQEFLRVAGWILIVVGLLAISVFALFLPALIAFVAVPTVWQHRNRAYRQALLAALAVAARHRMRLVPVLRAFQAEQREFVAYSFAFLVWINPRRAFQAEQGGFIALQAGQLADRLEAGIPLPDALDAAGGLFSAKVRLAIRMGYQSGQLPQALEELVDQAEAHDTLLAQLNAKLAYFLILPLFAGAIITFVMLKIVPALAMIFRDFDLELPALTRLVINISYWGASFWPLLMLVCVLLAVAARYALGPYVGFPKADATGFFGLGRHLHTALIFDCLALVARRNRPFAEALDSLGQWYPARGVRRRLIRASRDVGQGGQWSDSLRRRGLISPADLAVLQAAGRVGNLPWALHEMADAHRRRCAYRTHNWMQLLFVLGILVYGLIVFAFVVGMFLPLVVLIQALT